MIRMFLFRVVNISDLVRVKSRLTPSLLGTSACSKGQRGLEILADVSREVKQIIFSQNSMYFSKNLTSKIIIDFFLYILSKMAHGFGSPQYQEVEMKGFR